MMQENENLEEVLEETPVEEAEEKEEEVVKEEPETPQVQPRQDHPNFSQVRRQNKELFQRNAELTDTLKRLESRLSEDAAQFEDPDTRKIKELESKVSQWEEEKKRAEQEKKLYTVMEKSHRILSKVHGDFNEIYNEKNLNDFYDNNPDLEEYIQEEFRARGYQAAAKEAYRLLKDNGYGKKAAVQAQRDMRINMNSKKPQHAAPMGQVANAQRESTLERKARIRAETDAIIKGY